MHPEAHRPQASLGQGLDAWTTEALRCTTELPGVRRAGLALVEGGGRRLQFTASDRVADGAEGPAWCHIDGYDDVPLNTAVRTGRSVLGTVTALRDRYAEFAERQRETGTVAVAAVPLVADDQTVGAYVLFFDVPQPLDDAQRRRLEGLGAELGTSLRKAQRGVPRAAEGFTDDDVPDGASVAVLEVAPDPSAVGPARQFLRRTLVGWGVDDEEVYTATLCLSEVVTNALIHTQAGCAVRVLLDRGVLLTSVRDLGGSGGMAAEAPADPLQPHGRGLQVLEALAARWGSTVDARGTTVWFVLEPAASLPG
ncbi:MAG TPA: ATP-binding protein [Nocardioides sp.]|nr:ATP-binding protein [Nocardioides sp.]